MSSHIKVRLPEEAGAFSEVKVVFVEVEVGAVVVAGSNHLGC